MPDNFAFDIVFKDGIKLVAKVTGKRDLERKLGLPDIDPQKIQETEALLEKLTGFRTHIEMQQGGSEA